MENLINTINLTELHYPIFKLGIRKPEILDNVVFYLNQYEEDGKDTKILLKIVDDKNKPGETLGIRRLNLKVDGINLFRITKAVYFLGDLIKIAKPNIWFIDSNGRVFNYIKSTRVKLKYYKISNTIPIKGGGIIVELEGLQARFKSLFLPDSTFTYAGILHYNRSLILYGFYDKKYQESWRSI